MLRVQSDVTMEETNEAAKMWDCLCSGLLEPPGDAPPWTFARTKILLPLGRLFFDSQLTCQLIERGVAEQIKADQFHGPFAGTPSAATQEQERCDQSAINLQGHPTRTLRQPVAAS